MWKEIATAAAMMAVLIVGFGLGLGCAGVVTEPTRYAYFTTPAQDDAWSLKIAGWQRREQADQGEVPEATPRVAAAEDQSSPSQPSPEVDSTESLGDLRLKYFSFRADRKRQMARELAEWIQAQAKLHYVEDGPIDHWATLEETLRGDGDDCDGLELLAFHGLRDLGFDPREVYRAIVYRPSDGQHHMVTLWFEDQGDPWVIDPTGAMTRGMSRMSELPGWVPLKVFSDTVEFTVRRDSDRTIAPKLASNE